MATYNVMSYGAVGNGVANDTAAINAAIAACTSGTAAGIVYFPAGLYKITSTITVTGKTGCILRGEGRGASIILNSNKTSSAIVINACSNTGIEEMGFRSDLAGGNPTGGYAIEFTGGGYANWATKININPCYNGIRNFSCTETVIQDALIRSIYGIYGINYAGTAANGCYGMSVSDLIIDPVNPSNTSAILVLQDYYAYSLTMKRAALLTGGYGFVMQDSAGLGVSSRPHFAELVDMECDHNYSSGVWLRHGDGVYLTSCWVGSCLNGNGIFIDSTFAGDVGITTTRIVGNWQHGILVNGGPRDLAITTNIIGINSQQAVNTFMGVICAPTQQIVIDSNKSGNLTGSTNFQRYGVYMQAGSNNYVVTSNIVSGNVTGGVFNGGGAPNAVANNVG